MVDNNDYETGRLKVLGNIQELCTKSQAELVQWIANNFAVQFPDGVGRGVHVGTNQPTDPAATGIWVRINSASAFTGLLVFSEGEWIELDLGGCERALVAEGRVLVCSEGISYPITGDTAGKILTLDDPASGVSGYVNPYNNSIQGSDGSTDLGSKLLQNVLGDTYLETDSVDINIANFAPYRLKNAGLVATFRTEGNIQSADTGELPRVIFEIQAAYDAGAFSTIASLQDTWAVPGAATFRSDRHVSVALPLGLSLTPIVGATTLKLRGKVSLAYAGASGNSKYDVLHTYISALVVGLNEF